MLAWHVQGPEFNLWGVEKARKLNESVCFPGNYDYTPLSADGKPCKQQFILLHTAQ